jgi:hypothetical protein
VGEVVQLVTLEQHLSECEERYQGVVKRLDAIDIKMSRVELLMLDIKTILLQPNQYPDYDS